MKNIELICVLIDYPTFANLEINLYGECGKKFVFDVEEVYCSDDGVIKLIGKHREKRETGIEAVPQN